MSACRRIFLSLWMAALLLQTSWLPAQCEMCRTALADSIEGRQMAGAFNDGILFLLGAPLLVVGGIALLVIRERRPEKRDGNVTRDTSTSTLDV